MEMLGIVYGGESHIFFGLKPTMACTQWGDTSNVMVVLPREVV